MDSDTQTSAVPPAVKLFDYPAATSVVIVTVVVSLLLFVITRFDPARGTLAISLLIVFAFIGSLALSLRFVIPQDPETAALIGGVIAAMGAVVSYWLTPHRDKD